MEVSLRGVVIDSPKAGTSRAGEAARAKPGARKGVLLLHG